MIVIIIRHGADCMPLRNAVRMKRVVMIRRRIVRSVCETVLVTEFRMVFLQQCGQ